MWTAVEQYVYISNLRELTIAVHLFYFRWRKYIELIVYLNSDIDNLSKFL
jgi:hypothetical protein